MKPRSFVVLLAAFLMVAAAGEAQAQKIKVIVDQDARQACDFVPRKELEAFAQRAQVSFGFAQDRLSPPKKGDSG